jgi:predicted transcriptional regulator
MTKGIISIKFNEYLDMVAKVMLENGVNGLVVLDGNGSVAGMISKTNITRVLLLSNQIKSSTINCNSSLRDYQNDIFYTILLLKNQTHLWIENTSEF